MPASVWVPRSEFISLCLHSKPFTDWTISPAPKTWFLTITYMHILLIFFYILCGRQRSSLLYRRWLELRSGLFEMIKMEALNVKLGSQRWAHELIPKHPSQLQTTQRNRPALRPQPACRFLIAATVPLEQTLSKQLLSHVCASAMHLCLWVNSNQSFDWESRGLYYLCGSPGKECCSNRCQLFL